VAREEGILPGARIRLRMIAGHMGEERLAALVAVRGGARTLTGAARATPGRSQASGRAMRTSRFGVMRHPRTCSTSGPGCRRRTARPATWRHRSRISPTGRRTCGPAGRRKGGGSSPSPSAHSPHLAECPRCRSATPAFRPTSGAR
jgi:hypothetical protein